MSPETYEQILINITATATTPPENVATCGSCGRQWDDTMSTSITPTPAGRCPWEHLHDQWNAWPNEARWYGEVICQPTGGGDTDYFYGYSNAEDAPDVATLVPDGWTLLESTVKPTPGNPERTPETKES